MHRLLPDFIQKQYATHNQAGAFDACALFVDVSGFTPITDALMGHGQHGAEVLANIIRDLFDPLIQSVFEQGGFVTNLAGDAFTAVFPVSAEADPIASALAAAWQIQQAMAASPQHRTPYGAFAVSVKVGLAAGTVAWGIISSAAGHRAAYYFQGPAIAGAAAAEKLAKAGEVVVDASVAAATASLASVVAVDDHFRVTAIRGALSPPQAVRLAPAEPQIVSRFFPEAATRPTLGGEFRQVASMFISLPTIRTAEQLEAFMHIVFALQDRYGGLLNRLDMGDKGASLLLFWGAPVAHENDLARALNFVLDLQAQTVIPVKAGITYRIAHCGVSGGALAKEYTCHGRGTTLAARFMQASPRGEVWVDERVATRAARQFEIEFEGEIAFKGFAEEQKVFVLFERKEQIEPLFERQMVGRQAERQRLAGFVRPLWRGRCPGIMMVHGEAGIGKSRLLHAFLVDLQVDHGHAFSVFLCQTDEIFRESLNPFRYWLRRYFGQSAQQSEARNKRSFNRKLDRLIAATDDETLRVELDRTRSFLGALVNLSWPDSLYEQLDAQGRYENSFIGLQTLLLAESGQRPALLLLEDVQWLDADSIAFLQQFTRAMAQEQSNPIAILATGRPEGESAVFGDAIPCQAITLERMPAAHLETLATDQLGAPLGPALSALLGERAEGNPFFSEQILRYLQERELLRFADGKWELKARQDVALPSDVRTVLVARLDRLSHEVKEVVQTGSVLGREFEVKLLAGMLHDDPRFEEKVQQAEALSIWSLLNELRCLFKHALLRDAAYRMQVRSRRQALHRLAAEALEDLHAGDLTPHYGELAYHTERARLVDKARRYLRLAGETAEEAFHNTLAVDYYSRALTLTPDDALADRYHLLRAREQLYHILGARQQQLLDLDEMAQLADRLADVRKQVEVVIRRAWHYFWVADYWKMLEAGEKAAARVEEVGDDPLAAQAHYLMSWALLQLGERGAARRQAEEALAAARKSGSRRDEGNVHNVLGLIGMAVGDHSSAREHLRQFLQISRELKNKEREKIALLNLGVASVPLGDYRRARAYTEQSLALAHEMGDRVTPGAVLVNLAWVAACQGQWELAVQQAEAGVALKNENEEVEGEAEGLLWLGHGWSGLGQVDKAFTAYERSLQIRRDLGQEHFVMSVLAGMARVALAQDDLSAAAGYVNEILAYLDGGGSLDGTWEPLRITFTCYQVLQSSGDPRARDLLETSYGRLLQQADEMPDAETRRMFLENVPWNRAIVAAHRAMNR